MSKRRILSIVLLIGVVIGTFFLVRELNDPQRAYRESGKYLIFNLEGQQAPPFEAKVLGEDRSLTRDAIDKPTVFVFFATFCPHCKSMMPIVRDLSKTYGDRAQIWAVNGREYGNMPTEEREKRVSDWLTENSWADVPTLIAPTKMQSSFNLEAVPSVIVIDKAQRVHYVGLAAHDRARLDALLGEVL